jgi:hypothetical protein
MRPPSIVGDRHRRGRAKEGFTATTAGAAELPARLATIAGPPPARRQAIAAIKDAGIQRKVAAGIEGLPAEQVQRKVRQRQGKAVPKSKGESQTFRLRDGLRVTVTSRGELTGEDVVAVLEAALSQSARISKDRVIQQLRPGLISRSRIAGILRSPM